MKTPGSRLVVLFLLALLLPLRAAAQEVPASRPASRPAAGQAGVLHVLFTSDIYGRYAWPGCTSRRERGRAEMSHLVGAVSRLRREIRRRGEGEPLMVAGGSMIRPDVLGNHIFGEGRARAGSAVKLIRRVGFDAVAVGPYDFGAHPESLRRYMELMSREKIPLLAANVLCSKKSDFRCRYLGSGGRRYVVLQQGDMRVGIFAVVREDLTSRILARSQGSLKSTDPVKTTDSMVKLLRQEEKVDLVVLLASVNVEADSPQAVVDFVRGLAAPGPDLVVADTLYSREQEGFIREIRSEGGPLIVGTDRFGQHLGDAVIHYQRAPRGKVKVQYVGLEMVKVAGERPDPGSVPLVQDMRQELCRAIDQPLGRAQLARPMKVDAFRNYLMEIMRNRMGAEISALNDSAIADTPFPFSGTLTREMVLRAIRTETQLGFFRMNGANIIKKLGPYVTGDSKGLNVMGLTKKDKKWYVNNRLLNTSYHYKVATTRFVAGGGDELISLYTEQFSESGISLRKVAVDFFEADGPALFDKNPSVDEDTDFPDPWEAWLLYAGLDIGVSVNNVTVSNVDSSNKTLRYNLPLLKRDDVTSLRFDVGLDLGASNRNHAVEGDITMQYGQTWTLLQTDQLAGVEESDSAESLDRIRGDFLYRWTQFRNREAPGRWYIPVPYAEATLISEFTPSGCSPYGAVCDEEDPNFKSKPGETYQYLDMGGTVGLGLLLHPALFFKVGFALTGELLTPQEALAPGEEKEARTGLFVGYKLRRLKLNDSVRYPVQLESRLDFFMTDLGDAIRRELTWETKLLFSFLPMIHVSATHRLYAFDTKELDASVANDISLGVDFVYDVRHPIF